MENIGHYIGPALVALLVPLILGWLLRSASAKAKKINGIAWLNYGVTLKIFTLFFVGIVAGLVAIWFNVEPKDKIPLLFLIGLFGGLTLPMAIEFCLVRIGFDENGIYCYSGWRPKRTIDWTAIESVEFSQSMQWWVLRTKGAGKIRVSVLLSGLQEFLDELEKRGIIKS
jgi:hypothetical protein